MRIKAKTGGELNLPANAIHWIHKAGDERDFPDKTGKRILTSQNYEKAVARKPSQKETKPETTIKREPEKKEEPGRKKEKEGGK